MPKAQVTLRIVAPENRPPAFIGTETHARLRHDWATWHECGVARLPSTSTRLPFADRSKFDSARIIDEAVYRSGGLHAVQEDDGNYVISFDMGYRVGWDARAREQTSTVTVILKATGEVLTVYPGTPRSKQATTSTEPRSR